MENSERIRQLLDAFETGSITRDEFDELHKYLADLRHDDVFASWIDERLKLVRDENQKYDKKRAPKHKRLYWLSGAAATICLGIGLWWTLHHRPVHPPSSAQRAEPQETVPSVPSDRATLRLADGTIIDLEKMSSGLVANEAGAAVLLDDRQLVYRAQPSTSAQTAQTVNHTIHIPKGKQYQLTLPDGSRVWLNAATSFTFPVNFSDTLRLVSLRGEAYFEVEPDRARPFVVQTVLQSLKVLGTAFNVSAYAEDGFVKTSLVSGSVRVERADNSGNPLILRPGEESVVQEGHPRIKRQLIAVGQVATWRSGLFTFHKEPIEEVMRKVARWYDIEVEFRNGVAGKRIGGSIPRYDNIEKVMRALQNTGLLRYKMEGGKIIIMK